ncbi:MAG: ABC transporter permease [Thermoplasmata archaeon]|nr:ABC transporter permease [Thermoplasmata archaeon]
MKLFKERVEPEAAVEDDDRLGTWADTGYHATDEEAHRDVRYDKNSSVRRVLNVFMTQMKLYSKNKWVYIMVFASLLIPVIVYGVPSIIDAYMVYCGTSTEFIGLLLCMMPLMGAFFASVMCGTLIPIEFKDRTAYMSLPLPVTRLEFYFGKYLAGLVMCLGTFLMAFGIAILVAMGRYDTFYSDMIATALLATIVMIFAYSATSFCLGCFMRRGTTLLPLILWLAVLPGIAVYLYHNLDITAAMYLPCFLPDLALSSLGSPVIMSMTGMMSALSMLNATEMWTYLAVGVVWGILFLLIGAFQMKRREM